MKPSIYTWTLPTTGAALQIPPTGLTVDTVEFKPDCSETGCWVIKGLLTTGNAFNTFEAFNTLFLPQANITGLSETGDISFDYDYSAVDWTFSPANHPCTSAGYMAGAGASNTEISTCCITDPDDGSEGGFVANYRPTDAFVEWSGELRCDVSFERGGATHCWKFYRESVTWEAAGGKCQAAGGKLAVVADATEDTLISNYVNGNPSFYDFHFWLNLHNPSEVLSKDNWEWADGSNFTYRNWAVDASGERDGRYCAKKRAQGGAGGNGDWSDDSCTAAANAYVCEFVPPSFDATCIQHVVQRPRYSAPDPVRPCWNVYNNVAGGKYTWEQANASCVAEGGTLPLVRSSEENWFLQRLMDDNALGQHYLGLSDVDGTYTWSDGKERAWENFGNGHPQDGRCTRTQWDAVWDTVDCDVVRAHVFKTICELPRTEGATCDSDRLENAVSAPLTAATPLACASLAQHHCVLFLRPRGREGFRPSARTRTDLARARRSCPGTSPSPRSRWASWRASSRACLRPRASSPSPSSTPSSASTRTRSSSMRSSCARAQASSAAPSASYTRPPYPSPPRAPSSLPAHLLSLAPPLVGP